MIPVIIVPILSRPDVLKEMIGTIDHEIGLFYLIDNGDVVNADDLSSPYVGKFHVVRPRANLGVSASWNLGIRANYRAKWWMLANIDIKFGPGELEMLEDRIEHDYLACALFAFGAIGFHRTVFERIGLFDENFYPIYFEDNDFARRCDLAGIEINKIYGQTGHVSKDIGSVTIGDDFYRSQNIKSFPANAAYYARKWGGAPGAETLQTPFGLDVPLSYAPLAIDRLAQLGWETKDG